MLTDMHCHILPGVDDGSSNMTETREMLRIAYQDGIRIIIATPHYHKERGINDRLVWIQELEKVRMEAYKIDKSFQIYLGTEIYYGQDIAQELNDGSLCTMADSQYILMEFSVRATYRYILSAVQNIRLQGYLPIIAHVERYPALKDLDKVAELIKLGAFIQANADSVLGTRGWKAKHYLNNLLKNELIHVIGTDAHDSKNRTPRMSRCAAYIEKKYGSEYSQALCSANTRKILAKGYIK